MCAIQIKEHTTTPNRTLETYELLKLSRTQQHRRAIFTSKLVYTAQISVVRTKRNTN